MSIFNLESAKQGLLKNAHLTFNDILQSLNPPEIDQTILPNGLKVIYVQNTSLPTAIQCIFNVGFKDDGSLPGLSHLTEHMAFRGTVNRTAKDLWDKFIISCGGGAYTSYGLTNFHCYTNSNDYSGVVKTMVDMFSNSTLQNLEIEKKVVTHEITLDIDNPLHRLVNTIYSNALSKNICDYSLQKQTLSKITVDDVKGHMKKYYIPSNATLIISGNVGNQNSVLKTVDVLTASWKQPPVSQKNVQIVQQKLDILKQTLEVLNSNLEQPDIPRKGGQLAQDILDNLKTADNFEYKPGLYKDSMSTDTAHCILFLKGSPNNKDNIINFIKNGVLVNMIAKDQKEGSMIEMARYDTGLTYEGFRLDYCNQLDYGLWGLRSYTDKASAPALVKKMAEYLRDLGSKINNKNVDEAISNIKVNVNDIALRDSNISTADFKLVADSITAKDVKNYFDNSIASKCTIGVAGGFDDDALNDALYAEVNDILLSHG